MESDRHRLLCDLRLRRARVSCCHTPVIGANIGGGIAILFGVPFILGMVVWIVIAARDLRRSRRTAARALWEATNVPEPL